MPGYFAGLAFPDPGNGELGAIDTPILTRVEKCLLLDLGEECVQSFSSYGTEA